MHICCRWQDWCLHPFFSDILTKAEVFIINHDDYLTRMTPWYRWWKILPFLNSLVQINISRLEQIQASLCWKSWCFGTAYCDCGLSVATNSIWIENLSISLFVIKNARRAHRGSDGRLDGHSCWINGYQPLVQDSSHQSCTPTFRNPVKHWIEFDSINLINLLSTPNFVPLGNLTYSRVSF